MRRERIANRIVRKYRRPPNEIFMRFFPEDEEDNVTEPYDED
jgi:hypothetical protein